MRDYHHVFMLESVIRYRFGSASTTARMRAGSPATSPMMATAGERDSSGCEPASFFSFGTNDLTQTTLGVSRDDAARFLSIYVEKGIYARDPFGNGLCFVDETTLFTGVG